VIVGIVVAVLSIIRALEHTSMPTLQSATTRRSLRMTLKEQNERDNG
jgi:hypothetical protein